MSASKGNYDIYVVFVERGLGLLNKQGRLGFILPHKFFNAKYGEPLRRVISNGKHLAQVVHFGANQVFAGATTYTCLMFLDKASRKDCKVIKVGDLEGWRNKGDSTEGKIPATSITSAEWNFQVGKGADLCDKLKRMPDKLGAVADVFVGLQTSADDVFIMDFVEETPRALKLRSKSLGREWTFEKGLLFPLVSGTDVNRYSELPKRQYILFPYLLKGESATLLSFSLLEKDYPKTGNYLLENKKRLEEREKGKFKGRDWYRFGRNQNIGIQGRIKLCVPRLVDRLYAAFDSEGLRFLDNVDVGGITLKTQYQRQSLLYLLGLLNSNLLRWFFPSVSAPFRGGWLSANRQFLSQLPIRLINFSNRSDKAKHDKMVRLVERMMKLHKELAKAKSEQDKTLLQRQISSADHLIDQIVYRLYALTQEEINLIVKMV